MNYKNSVIFCLLCCLNLTVVAQHHVAESPINVVSPVVLSNNRVAFKIYAPKAKKVNLKSADRWDNIEFKKDDHGVWEGVWENVIPGAYRYFFIVDGVSVYNIKTSSAFETNALFTYTPKGDEFFALKEKIPHGALSQRFYYSKVLQKTQRMQIWTPSGFEKIGTKMPVLYLIHGGGDNDRSWSEVGCACNILDNLMAAGKIKPMVVVMPDGSIPTNKMLDRPVLFAKLLMKDIIPFVESNYKVYTDSEHRAIMGLSMGGLETLEAIMTYPDAFGYVCPLSSGWWLSKEWIEKRMISDNKEARIARINKIASKLNSSLKLLYFTQGGPEDLAYSNGMETLKIFKDAGVKFQYSESPGGHTWKVWRKNLHDLVPLLFN